MRRVLIDRQDLDALIRYITAATTAGDWPQIVLGVAASSG